MARASRRFGGLWFGVVSVLLLGAIAAVVVIIILPPATTDNPFDGRALYVYPDSSAAQAAAAATDPDAASAFSTLASTPSAIWLLPETHPAAEVASFVDRIESDASGRKQLPVFVVYGVPSRDCGNFSAGGLQAADYGPWTSAIAEGIAQRPTILILEPDSLALSPECGTEEATAGFIRDAIARLSATGTTIYLDGGHSTWLGADAMAALLKRAGVDEVRGFVTNVSNYNATSAERDYGQRLSALLGGAHYVIDTSRNGSGTTGEWCNPPGRTIGDTPSGVDDGTPQDASLWVKNPGESDGTCNGGPPAGQWWAEKALELVRGGS